MQYHPTNGCFYNSINYNLYHNNIMYKCTYIFYIFIIYIILLFGIQSQYYVHFIYAILPCIFEFMYNMYDSSL